MDVKKKVVDQILKAETIVISSHIRPDTDCVGSGLALYHCLNQIGKKVAFYNTDQASFPLTALPGYDQIQFRQTYPEKFDLYILIEGGTETRTGQQHLESYRTINIDHHAASVNDADLNWVEPDAAAVAVLVYELALELNVTITAEIGFNLYAAISSDTGSFKYSNTTERAHRYASEIIQKSGISPEEVSDLLYNSNSIEKIRVIQKVLATLELYLDDQVSVIELRRDFLETIPMKTIETEDIVGLARSIKSLKATLFFKEIGDDYYRVSIRAKGDFNSQNVAKVFGGGGHNHAAGFFYQGDIQSAKRDIIVIIKEELSR